MSASRLGLPLIDGLHMTSAGYQEACRRDALTVARNVFGLATHDGRGPLPTGATRDGATITVTLDPNGAEAVTGTALTGYELSADGFATILPLSSADVAGGAIVLRLRDMPTGPVAVRSFAGGDYDDARLALGRYADGTTIPVFPIVLPLVAA